MPTQISGRSLDGGRDASRVAEAGAGSELRFRGVAIVIINRAEAIPFAISDCG
jgi:hypothetical protein